LEKEELARFLRLLIQLLTEQETINAHMAGNMEEKASHQFSKLMKDLL
jgi:hypothetical protein